MENVTNNIHNIGKPLKDQKFTLSVDYGDLLFLTALAKEPPARFADDEGLVEAFKEFYRTIKAIKDAVEDKANAKG